MSKKKVGTITHYYDKIGVAVVKLTSSDLKVGDKVEIMSQDNKPFAQEISSMQIEHAFIDIAKAGDEFGMKVDLRAKIRSDVFKS